MVNRNFFICMSKLFHNNNDGPAGKLFEAWSFSQTNYILFGAGLLIIIIGYIVMATGDTYSRQSLTVAPIMLFIGYIILIPASLIYKKDRSRSDQGTGS